MKKQYVQSAEMHFNCVLETNYQSNSLSKKKKKKRKLVKKCIFVFLRVSLKKKHIHCEIFKIDTEASQFLKRLQQYLNAHFHLIYIYIFFDIYIKNF